MRINKILKNIQAMTKFLMMKKEDLNNTYYEFRKVDLQIKIHQINKKVLKRKINNFKNNLEIYLKTKIKKIKKLIKNLIFN